MEEANAGHAALHDFMQFLSPLNATSFSPPCPRMRDRPFSLRHLHMMQLLMWPHAPMHPLHCRSAN